MGTRSTVSFFENKKHLVSIYQQYDGYLSGVGEELKDFLNEKVLVNGVNSKMDRSKIANGTGCLAAQFIERFKNGLGLYIDFSGDGKRCFGEYSPNLDQMFSYQVNVRVDWQTGFDCTQTVELCVFGHAGREVGEKEEYLEDKIFEGSLTEFNEFLKVWD